MKFDASKFYFIFLNIVELLLIILFSITKFQQNN